MNEILHFLKLGWAVQVHNGETDERLYVTLCPPNEQEDTTVVAYYGDVADLGPVSTSLLIDARLRMFREIHKI